MSRISDMDRHLSIRPFDEALDTTECEKRRLSLRAQ
jgi:hypothetical protein